MLPKLKSGKQIRREIEETRAAFDQLIASQQELEAAISRLPNGPEKQALKKAWEAVQRSVGMFDESTVRPAARSGWTSQQWLAEAFRLKEEGRQWKRVQNVAKARSCERAAKDAETRGLLLRQSEP